MVAPVDVHGPFGLFLARFEYLRYHSVALVVRWLDASRGSVHSEYGILVRKAAAQPPNVRLAYARRTIDP